MHAADEVLACITAVCTDIVVEVRNLVERQAVQPPYRRLMPVQCRPTPVLLYTAVLASAAKAVATARQCLALRMREVATTTLTLPTWARARLKGLYLAATVYRATIAADACKQAPTHKSQKSMQV